VTAVLLFEGPQPCGLGRRHAAILRLPFLEGDVADPVFAADLFGPHPGVMFGEDRDDLFLSVSAASHRRWTKLIKAGI
jgi:hypothetical protein